MEKLTTRIGADYVDGNEFWFVEILQGGKVLASAQQLASAAIARTAGEYLKVGLVSGFEWQSVTHVDDVAEGLASLRADLNPDLSAAKRVADAWEYAVMALQSARCRRLSRVVEAAQA